MADCQQHGVAAWQLRGLWTDVQELTSSLKQAPPWRIKGSWLIVGLFIERFGAAGRIDLDELHYAIHPR